MLRKTRVKFDTGASLSLLTLDAAKRSGFRLDGPETIPAGVAVGIGAMRAPMWFAPFDLLDLGGEKVKNARLMVADVYIPGHADLLLGADFFLSHRLYVARDQQKIYFTFNGGKVFARSTASPAAAPSAAAQ